MVVFLIFRPTEEVYHDYYTIHHHDATSSADDGALTAGADEVVEAADPYLLATALVEEGCCRGMGSGAGSAGRGAGRGRR